MPISFTNYQPGTPEQVSPYANLISNAMKNYQSAVSARYAPQTIQANIFNKKFAPLAQIASNPLAMAMMGDKGQGIMDAIQQLLSQGGTPGSSGMPMPSDNNQSMGGGAIGQGNPGGNSSFTGGQSPSIGQGGSSTNTGYNPAIPQAGQGLKGAAEAKVQVPYNAQAVAAGTSFYDPATDKFYSQPTDSTVSVSQQSINAIKRVMPQLKDIAKKSDEFLKPGGMLNTYASRIGGALSNWTGLDPKTLKNAGVDPEKFSRYAGWHSEINQAMESLMSSYPNIPRTDDSLKLMGNILMPQTGETNKGYFKRVIETVDRLGNQQLPAIQSQLNPLAISGNNQNSAKAVSNEIKNSPPSTKKLRPGTQDTKNINGAIFDKIGDKWYAYLGE